MDVLGHAAQACGLSERERVPSTLQNSPEVIVSARFLPGIIRGGWSSPLGPYEITSQIGIGGMGELYRATDTNLKRLVAIKVLPAPVAADTVRLARFQREAEVLASFNHPNIAAIYGLERTGAATALVMELVEGPTLADRIAHGAIPVDEALAIAKQINEALEAAHELGIIHRDLKPANIKIRASGDADRDDPASDSAPVWSPDGGAGSDELVLKTGERKIPPDWSQDGRWLLFRANSRCRRMAVLPRSGR
jgi:serine/threonine protein kinase